MKEFLTAIRTILQPQARAEATAAIFADFIATTQIEPLALKRGLLELETPRANPAQNIAARRRTCGELAQLIDGNAVCNTSHLVSAVQSWSLWVHRLTERLRYETPGNLPRLNSVLETATREYHELKQLL